MLALSTIDYQEMTDNNAINTQNDKEERKIGDKEKRRKYRDSTKSHNTCPKDGKRQRDKSFFPKEKEKEQNQIQNDQISQNCYKFIDLTGG